MKRTHRAAASAAALVGGLGIAFVPAAPAHAAVTATFAFGQLSVTGDSAGNVITVRRDAVGVITVTGFGGTPIPVSGGIPTVANTSSIAVRSDAGEDSVRLDETAGVLPRALLVLGDDKDFATGGSGSDLIIGDGGVDVLDGGPGADTVDGGDGDDFLRPGKGDGDVVTGGVGDDELTWRSDDGNDRLEGGAGVDEVRAEAADTSAIFVIEAGAEPSESRVSEVGAGTLTAVTEILEVAGGSGSDTMLTSPGAAGPPLSTQLRLLGAQGNDALFGGSGDDELVGADGIDVLAGGPGNDLLRGSSDGDVLRGEAGSDRVEGEAGDDTVEWSAGHGDDVVEGGTGDDVVKVDTGPAPDTAFAAAAAGGRVAVRSPGVFALDLTSERVELRGGGANDNLSVGVGLGALTRVLLDGGVGDDRLNGSDGVDRLSGADGNDLLFGEGGDDVLDGGLGKDQILGRGGHDLANGGDGDDVVLGNGGNDNLDGGAGFDFLRGGPGFDVGFNGEDVLGVP